MTKYSNFPHAPARLDVNRGRANALIDRRALMLGSATSIAGLALSFAGRTAVADTVPKHASQVAFSPAKLLKLARSVAATPYKKPDASVLSAAPALSYDEYRDIRFRPERAIWRGKDSRTEVQLFATGYLANTPVDIWLVENGKAHKLDANPKDFSLGRLARAKDPHAPHALSGFRLHAPINRDDYFDEHTVFQGASYFRAVARGQVYGLSARGLAINTARSKGEEFPVFRSFWIEKPRNGSDTVTVHALLDSKSVAGLYQFIIHPGMETTMEVSATLFPRTEMKHAGLAPLTSMYLLGPASRRIKNDFRPAVHDSEGLAIHNGRNEHLWRPLTNPKTLQTSVFLDNDPKGFGLIQRDRAFKSFEDLEAAYERRPSVWVEPIGAWGRGHVELLEIPTDEEIHDNIVAYWKPETPLKPGRPHKFTYRLRWGHGPANETIGQIAQTRVGKDVKPGATRFVVDIRGDALNALAILPQPKLTSPHARAVGPVTVQKNSHIDGVRASFALETKDVAFADLRLDLLADGKRVSESWLYRWTRT